MKEILVIGGTGAQGSSVVESLSSSGRYSVRVLTRNTTSDRAKTLAGLPHVTLIEGSQDRIEDLHRAFHGVYGAYVNTDGFTIGEKNELFYGIRAYEIARGEGVQHYVYASTDYPLKDTNWNPKYRWGHNDAKGRVADFILSQGQEGMKTSVLVTGPYMDMLFDGMFVPEEQDDGTFVWANPSKEGNIPLIALQDVGPYAMWMLDTPEESAGLLLKIATDEVTFEDVARIFTEVTGKKAAHQRLSLEEFLAKAEPFPNAPSNWAAGPNAPRDESTMTWKENFGAWWMYWGEGKCEARDKALLDKIHPKRISSLKEWMELVKYDGQRRSVLKGIADLKAAVAAMQTGAGK